MVRKNFGKIHTALLIVFISFSVFGQTAWTDSGTEGGDAFIKKITLAGTVDGTDTLKSGVFNFKQFKNAHTFNIVTTSDDSIHFKVEREYLSPSGTWVPTAVGSDTVTTVVQWADTLESINTQWRWSVFGSSSAGGDVNGFNKGFKADIFFERKDP